MEKKICVDCGKEAWGEYLTHLKDAPLHTWCFRARLRVARLYTFRGK